MSARRGDRRPPPVVAHLRGDAQHARARAQPNPADARVHAGHARGAGHAHAHRELGRRGLTWVLALTVAFTIAELVGGWVSNSLALLADAAHMLADVGSIALSLFALTVARRPATLEKTYGYARLEILAALLNGGFLLVIAAGIVWEGVRRLGRPEPVQSGIMIAVAAAGLAANVVAALMLHRAAGESLNIRGAYVHVLGDLLGSAGAIVAGIVILATGWLAADPLISFLVAALIVVSSWKLLREAVDVLLESAPAHIDMADVRRVMEEIPGVHDVHDLHVWTVTSGFLAMSGHAVIYEPARSQAILDQIHARIRERFHIEHTTIQLECRAPVQLKAPEG